MWGGEGKGSLCDACDTLITKDEFVIGGVFVLDGKDAVHFHVHCFWLWESEVRARARGDEIPAPGLCAHCRKLILAEEARTTIVDVAYHAACWSQKIRER